MKIHFLISSNTCIQQFLIINFHFLLHHILFPFLFIFLYVSCCRCYCCKICHWFCIIVILFKTQVIPIACPRYGKECLCSLLLSSILYLSSLWKHLLSEFLSFLCSRPSFSCEHNFGEHPVTTLQNCMCDRSGNSFISDFALIFTEETDWEYSVFNSCQKTI